MYAWIWRRLPGTWQVKTAVAAVLLIVAGLLLWYVVFPWLDPRLQFDHGVVDGTPSTPARPG
ncbi:hypothetical protein [Actinomadura roseirufa]|uniref:hypothetical protein n=1 Tax=Actinomadura roseirufa TaxID=2094049 RepID=UPI0010410189|nr:hypothetical protein [Actinomadura roseirufa]